MRRTKHTPLLVACFLITVSVVATPQCPVGKFAASPYPGDQFGRALSVSGDELGVGGWGSAAVFVLDDNGTPMLAMDDAWLLQTAMYSPNPWDDNYGASVWLEADHLVVGAPTEGGIFGFGPGAAYIYRRVPNGHSPLDDGWVEQVKLAPLSGQSTGFGASVCLSGDYAAIGALQDHVSSQTSSFGTVHIYRRDDNGTPHEPTDDLWLEQAVVVSADSSYGRFGEVVRLEGKRLLVSAPYGLGAVYSFWRDDQGTPDDPLDDTWVEHAKVTAPGAPGPARFGRALDFDGSLMAVGAVSGAYLFRLNDNGTPLDFADDSWTDEAALFASDSRSATVAYGSAVAVQGNLALVGDPVKDESEPFEPKYGATYVFRNDSGQAATPGSRWAEVTRLTPPMMPAREFGAAVRLDGIRAFVGEIGHFSFLPGGAKDWEAGAVWQYGLAVPPWSFVDAALPGSGGLPSLMASGSLEGDALTVISIDMDLAAAATALVIGLSALDAPFKGGVLVPQPDSVSWVMTDPSGQVTLTGRWPQGVASHTELYFQAWAIDPKGPVGLSATNAIRGATP